MTNKMTISERINAISFETLTEDEFKFLIERAQKSVRKATKGERKMTKAQVENAALAEKIAEFAAGRENVTCADVEAEFGISNHKAAAILNRSGKFVKVVEGKGKVKSAWAVA